MELDDKSNDAQVFQPFEKRNSGEELTCTALLAKQTKMTELAQQKGILVQENSSVLMCEDIYCFGKSPLALSEDVML